MNKLTSKLLKTLFLISLLFCVPLEGYTQTAYIDRFNGSIIPGFGKSPAVVATTGNITLSGYQTIDGVSVNADYIYRVLVKNQTDSTQNGLYVAFSGAWQRSGDFAGPSGIAQGQLVYVYGGNTQFGLWQLTTANPVIISPATNASAITFSAYNTVSTAPTFWVENYGAKCNGSTDDSAAFINAGNAALASVPKGIVLVPGAVCNIATTGNVTLPGVTYKGDISAYGYNTNFATAPYTLLINPSYTVSLSSGGALVGVRVYPQSMGQQASTLRGAITQIATFAGTAVTVPANQYDITIDHVMINGFAKAISHNSSDRVHYSYVSGDDTTFFDMNGCGDTCTAYQMEAWPFMASPYAINPQSQTTAISSFSSAGGLVKVTFASPPAIPIVTGDSVVIGNTTPAYQFPNGRWTVTAIDTTHFTLNGSTYSGASATNEIVYLAASMRTGPAFHIQNADIEMVALTDYGHDISYWYDTGVDGINCIACWSDGDTYDGTLADPNPIGVLNGGKPAASAVLTQHTAFNGGHIYSKAYAIYNNSSSGRPMLVTNVAPIQDTGSYANLNGGGVYVASGSVFVSNSSFEGASTGNIFYVADNATQLSLSNIKTEGGIAAFQTSSTDCQKYSLDGVVNCPWTPIITIGNSSTGITYSRQLGNYQIVGSVVTANFCNIMTSIGGLTGNVQLTNFPVTVSSGNEAVGAGGLIPNFQNLSSVTGFPVVFMNGGTTTAQIKQATGILTNSNIADNSSLCGSVQYEK